LLDFFNLASEGPAVPYTCVVSHPWLVPLVGDGPD